MQPYVSSLGLLILSAPALAAVVLAASSRRYKERLKGWRHVTPGFSYWLPFVLGLGISALIFWVWAFVGSARKDAAFQMLIAWWLALAFGLMACWCAWRILRFEQRSLRWRGNKLVWKVSGTFHERSLAEVAKIDFGFGGNAVVIFSNGEKIFVDMSSHNSSELIARIEELNELAELGTPGEH